MILFRKDTLGILCSFSFYLRIPLAKISASG